MSPTSLVRALRKWWWVLLALSVIGALLGGAATFVMTPKYSSTSQVFVAFDVPAGAGPADVVQANNFAIQKVYSYTEVVKSPRSLNGVIDDLGLDATPEEVARDISVTVPPNSTVMRITGVADTPEDAVALTESVVDNFSEVVVEIETTSAGDPPPIRIDSLADPVPAESPSSPNLLVNVALGLFAGFGIGVIWIAVAALRDRRVYTRADLAGAPDSLSLLGTVPSGAGSDSTTVLVDDPGSEVAEAYRAIAATLGHSPAGALGVVAVATATPRDSSSALTTGLALAFSEFGARVAVIDANLRSGRISASLGLSGPGLAECLAGGASPGDVLASVNGVSILPAGTTSEPPSELIAGSRFDEVVKALAQTHDVVFIDAAPVLPLSDTLFAASAATSTILAVSAGSVTTDQLDAARNALGGVGAEVRGVVVLDAARSGADADVATAAYRDLRPVRR